jgi:mannan endo-1,4-beta-mannosidase
MRSRPILVVATALFVFLVVGCRSTATTVGSTAKPKGSLCAARERSHEVYLGVYVDGFPPSTAPIEQFADSVGIQPDMITFYPKFGQHFDAGAACAIVKEGAVPVLQLDPENVSLSSIAAGKHDRYLRAFAAAVKKFGDRIVLSFGHEMNGDWYSWGYQHTQPAVFVAAWRHIVNVFRAVGASNVTWLWTVNVINESRAGRIPSPAPWWPGASYVNWVGIDGYYYKPSWVFVSLFGPTIAAVRGFTHDPILIAETGASPASVQPAKIADIFSGIRSYSLLGFVWFDAQGATRDWQITSPAAMAAFRKGAESYLAPAP